MGNMLHKNVAYMTQHLDYIVKMLLRFNYVFILLYFHTSYFHIFFGNILQTNGKVSI